MSLNGKPLSCDQVSDDSTTCDGLGRVAAMLDDVVYRDQQVPLSRDSSLLKSLLPGNRRFVLLGEADLPFYTTVLIDSNFSGGAKPTQLRVLNKS